MRSAPVTSSSVREKWRIAGPKFAASASSRWAIPGVCRCEQTITQPGMPIPFCMRATNQRSFSNSGSADAIALQTPQLSS